MPRHSQQRHKPRDAEDREIRPNRAIRGPALYSFNESNYISTTKFTPVTWLPLSLLYQFKRAANVYFLVVTILTTLKFSPKLWPSRVATFAFVLLWTALKDGWEDYQRHKSDKKENERVCRIYDESVNDFVSEQWQNVKLGHLLRVEIDEQFPADLVVLCSSYPEGHCYVDTANLDGETNLKYKKASSRLVDEFTAKPLSGATEVKDDDDVQSNPDSAEVNMTNIKQSPLKVKYEAPHEDMHEFSGAFQLPGCIETPLNLSHMLYRGCVLRNTQYVIGLVVYSGYESKVMMNARDPPHKIPNMQHVLNRLLKGMFSFLAFLALFSTIMSIIWETTLEPNKPYLLMDQDPDELDWYELTDEVDFRFVVIKLLVYVITFSHLIPMSLYVALEMLKLSLKFQVDWDLDLVDPETGVSALARTSDLMEELGQAEFVFSDKTGTLTCNCMEFVRCSVNGKTFGPVDSQECKVNRELGKATYGICGDTSVVDILRDKQHADQPRLLRFFTILATCHTVVPQEKKKRRQTASIHAPTGEQSVPTVMGENTVQVKGKEIDYQGSSPDEVALVRAAAFCGVAFLKKGHNKELVVRQPDGKTITYMLRHVLDFTPERKRMSVIVEFKPPNSQPSADDFNAGDGDDSGVGGIDLPPGVKKPPKQIYLFTKGADSTLLPLLRKSLSPDDPTVAAIDAFSRDGLRTLVVAWKRLDPAVYVEWAKEYHQATIALNHRSALMAEVSCKIETQLELVGVTAVEDRLQEGVPSAIATIKAAGMRLWVLTGDKLETAVDIGYSCQLLTRDMHVVRVVGITSPETMMSCLRACDTYEGISQGKPLGLAVDGSSIATALADDECKAKLLQVALKASACICCRLAPMQKSLLVKLVRKNLPGMITVAVGDGANDVAMIQEAHIGIGIRGKEGSQAVQASDYAVSQFRYLTSLFLVHGRMAYRRIATFMCYYFYKNIALAFGDVVWTNYNGYSGQIMYPEWLTTCYNAMWTSFPAIFCFALDHDVPKNVARIAPNLYRSGPQRQLFNRKVFWLWVFFAVWHGVCAWYGPMMALLGPARADGQIMGFWWASVSSFSVIIIIVTVKLMISTNFWRKMSLAEWCSGVTVFSAVLYLVFVVVLNFKSFAIAYQPQIYNVVTDLMQSPLSFIVTMLVPAVALFPDFLYESARFNFFFNPLDLQMYQCRAANHNACFCGTYPPDDSSDEIQIVRARQWQAKASLGGVEGVSGAGPRVQDESGITPVAAEDSSSYLPVPSLSADIRQAVPVSTAHFIRRESSDINAEVVVQAAKALSPALDSSALHMPATAKRVSTRAGPRLSIGKGLSGIREGDAGSRRGSGLGGIAESHAPAEVVAVPLEVADVQDDEL